MDSGLEAGICRKRVDLQKVERHLKPSSQPSGATLARGKVALSLLGMSRDEYAVIPGDRYNLWAGERFSDESLTGKFAGPTSARIGSAGRQS